MHFGFVISGSNIKLLGYMQIPASTNECRS